MTINGGGGQTLLQLYTKKFKVFLGEIRWRSFATLRTTKIRSVGKGDFAPSHYVSLQADFARGLRINRHPESGEGFSPQEESFQNQ